VIEGRAERDEWLPLGAGLELGDELVEVGSRPRVQIGQGDRLALLGVGDQIDQPGSGQPSRRIGFEPLVDQELASGTQDE
jgi:hypothetical protein